MESYQDGHNFAQAEAALSVAQFESESQELLFPLRFKGLAEIID
ncbi:hypothetical protein [Chroococcidiopsis sp. CCMEE 29]|nr:hypothetical protein [Chroococcidiopsis sp. CCMEE 29]